MDKLASAHLTIADALGDLAKLFQPGMRLTFIARHPDHAERHVIVTDDDMKGLAELLAREAAKEKP